MECCSTAGITPRNKFASTVICTPRWREAMWEWSVLPNNTIQCPWSGLEPEPLDREASALTVRSPRLFARTRKTHTLLLLSTAVILIYAIYFLLLQECDFVKLRDDSYLRVVYMGNIRIQGCTACCKRWYFTFNNAECSDPAPIDGSLYQSININIHRPTNIEGYCGSIAAGKVRVGFSLGNCKVPFNTNGDAFTGSNQANRIIIEEVEPPVA